MCVSRSCSVERVMLEAIGRNMHSEDAPCLMMGGLMTRGCGCCQPWPHGLPQLIRSLCDVGQSVALIQCIADVPACRALRACMSPSSVPVWPRNRPKLTSARSSAFKTAMRLCVCFMRVCSPLWWYVSLRILSAVASGWQSWHDCSDWQSIHSTTYCERVHLYLPRMV